MRIIRLIVVSASALAAGALASAQETIVGEPQITDAYTCPDPPEPITRVECCRITVTVDATGKATSAEAKCTLPSLEATQAQCELDRPHEPRIRTGGKREGYTRTFNQTHLPNAPKSMEELKAMLLDNSAEKRCEDLEPHT